MDISPTDLPPTAFPDGQFSEESSPNGHFPYVHFPELHLIKRTFNWTDISPNHLFNFRNKKVIEMNYVNLK